MSYEWVGVVATAAVGVAGIASTWLLARANRGDQERLLRMQHEEGRKTALLDARREAYKALSINLQDCISYAGVQSPNGDDVRELIRELSRSLANVEFLGADAVRQAAPQISMKVISYLSERLEGNKESADRMREVIKDQLTFVRLIMASDLGLTVAVSMDETMKLIDTLNDIEGFIRLRKERHFYDESLPSDNSGRGEDGKSRA